MEASFKPGDHVVMNGNYYVHKSNQGHVWTVRSTPFMVCGTECVLLEGRTGGYACDGLTKVEDVE